MKNIIKTFIQYPFLGKMIIFLLLMMGFFAYSSMKKSSFPEEESRTITVSVSYPGATPKEMELSVTTLIENALRGIPGIKETTSKSMENYTNVVVTVLKSADTEQVLTEVKNAVDGISNLPAAADRPIVNWKKRTAMAMFLNLSGNVSLMKLKETADHIEDDFMNSGIVSQVTISGVPSLELSVEVKEENLRRYNLTLADVERAVAANNLDISGGVIRNPREEMNVLSRMRSVSPEIVEKIVVKSDKNGAIVRISDIAHVKFQFAESPSSAMVDGHPAISIQVKKLNSEDLADISQYVKEYIEKFNGDNTNMSLSTTFDFNDILQGRIDILTQNGIIGIVLVVIFLSLFLNIRLSLWVAWGIPASFLGMFIIGYLVGITINMISLFGMIMVIGILVDDGIVIGENIYSHYEKGKNPWKAAVDGTMEVLPAIFTSVSTTMIAFTPLMFLQGHMSFMSEMAIVVIACLAMSIFEGVFVLPSHLSSPKILKKEKETGFFSRIRGGIDKFLFTLRDRLYILALKRLMKYKWAALAMPLVLIMLTFGLVGGGKIGVTFFPNVEDDYFTIELALKPGTSVEVTRKHLADIEEACKRVSVKMTEDYKEPVPIIRSLEVHTGGAFSGAETGTHCGTVYVMLKDIENIKWSVSEVKKRIYKEVGEIPEAYKFAVGASTRWGAPVSISLLSSNEQKLEESAEWFKNQLKEIPALYNVLDNNRLGSQEIRIIPNEKAYILGLTQQSLMSQVRKGFFGGQAQRLVKGKNEVRVYVRYPREDRLNQGQLENMKIVTPSGEFPLYTLADLSIDRSPVVINRFNGRREITVSAYQQNPNEPLSPVIDVVEKKILPELKEKFSGVNYRYRGQMKGSAEESEDLKNGFSIAFLIIILIIMLHYKSFYQGMLILAVIPLGWIAAVWGHGIEGYPLSLLSAFGIVALSGTIINDAVVFLSKYNQNLGENMPVTDALIDAGKSRFRPILLTSLTTVAGLYPLILETSMQARFLIPMAVSLAYGIMLGTILLLLFLPVFVLCGNSVRRYWKYLWKGKKMTAEEAEPYVMINNHKQLVEENI